MKRRWPHLKVAQVTQVQVVDAHQLVIVPGQRVLALPHAHKAAPTGMLPVPPACAGHAACSCVSACAAPSSLTEWNSLAPGCACAGGGRLGDSSSGGAGGWRLQPLRNDRAAAARRTAATHRQRPLLSSRGLPAAAWPASKQHRQASASAAAAARIPAAGWRDHRRSSLPRQLINGRTMRCAERCGSRAGWLMMGVLAVLVEGFSARGDQQCISGVWPCSERDDFKRVRRPTQAVLVSCRPRCA